MAIFNALSYTVSVFITFAHRIKNLHSNVRAIFS